MAYPTFYNPERVGQLFVPDTASAINAGLVADLKPASNDSHQHLLLLVDAQVDFVHIDGALSVPGAVDDTRRTIEWLFEHAEHISAVAASMDSHLPVQIFYPTWWVNPQGDHPEPYTVITSDAVKDGEWKPTFEPQWSVDYVQKLELQSKKQLMIWPYHTMIGTPGHTLTPALYEALAYHAAARQSEPVYLQKGTIAKTEYYSMLEPEVKVAGEPGGELNTDFLAMLEHYDRIYIAGQAKSHCVLETISSMMRHFGSNRPEMIDKLFVLIDCTSSVAHPEIDFEAIATEALASFAEKGLHIIQSSDPLP